jgi:AcrR family transcriptional regulator
MRVMPPHPPLPPRKKHRDLPPWKHGVDNVQRRTADAAWVALFKRDWADVSFKELAKQVGVTTPALYHHYPTLSHVALTVAQAALAKLRGEVVAAFNRSIDARLKPRRILHKAITAYWAFARKRPRHFDLAFSSQFNADPQVIERRESVRFCLEEALAVVTRDPSVRPRAAELWALVHGAACVIAMGKTLEEDHLMAFVDRHIVTLDAAARHP